MAGTSSTAQLVDLIKSIDSQIAAARSGNPTGSPVGSSQPSVADLLAGPIAAPDKVAVQAAQQHINQGGSLSDLSPQVQQLIESTQRINSQVPQQHSGWSLNPIHDIAHAAGDVKNIGGNALGKVADVLSRGEYAVANATKEAGEYGATHKGNSLKDVYEYFLAKPAEGALAGLEGKKKQNFEGDIQEGADIRANEKAGLTPTAAVTKAQNFPGTAHVNPFLKYGGGLTADIIADPTTYIGTGLAGKVLKGTDEIASASKGAKAVEDLLPPALEKGKVVRRATLLTPDKASEYIQKADPELTIRAAKMARDTMASAQEKAIKDLKLPADVLESPLGKKYQPIINKAVRELVGTGSKSVTASEKALASQFKDEMVKALHESTHPEISRKLGISFAGKHIGSIPLERLNTAIDTAKAGNGTIGKSLNSFDNAMRYSANISPALRGVAARARAGERAHALDRELINAFDGVSIKDRTAALNNWRAGLTNAPVLNSAGKDVAKSLNEVFARVQKSVRDGEVTLADLNVHLHAPMKISNLGLAQTDPDFLVNHIKRALDKSAYKPFHDPAYIMQRLNLAHVRALGDNKMREEIAKTFGHDVSTVSGKALRDKFGYREPQRIVKTGLGDNARNVRQFRGKVFDPETANGIEQLLKHTVDGNPSNLMRVLDKGLYEWKSLVTKYNPGYYERNLYGEMFNNYLAGVIHPLAYQRAVKVLRGRGKTALNEEAAERAGVGASKLDIRAANSLLPNKTELAVDHGGVVLRRKIGRKIETLTTDHLWHLYDSEGLHTGFLTTDLHRVVPTTGNKVSGVLARVNQRTTHAVEDVEDFARMAHFIDFISKSKKPIDEAARDAAQEVKKYHFDYNEFTKFEKTKLGRAFPFYKWTRKNIPLMLEMTLVKPGRVIAPLKAENALSELLGYKDNGNRSPVGDLVVPDWLKKDAAVPLGRFGGKSTTYLDPPLPWQQAFETLQSPIKTAEQMATPYVQTPVELALHKNLAGYDETNNKIFANQLPATTLINNLLTSKSQNKNDLVTALQFLTGSGLTENTENRQLAEARREQATAIAKRKRYLTSKSGG